MRAGASPVRLVWVGVGRWFSLSLYLPWERRESRRWVRTEDRRNRRQYRLCRQAVWTASGRWGFSCRSDVSRDPALRARAMPGCSDNFSRDLRRSRRRRKCERSWESCPCEAGQGSDDSASVIASMPEAWSQRYSAGAGSCRIRPVFPVATCVAPTEAGEGQANGLPQGDSKQELPPRGTVASAMATAPSSLPPYPSQFPSQEPDRPAGASRQQ